MAHVRQGQNYVSKNVRGEHVFISPTIKYIGDKMLTCPKSRAYSLMKSIENGTRPDLNGANIIELYGDGETKILQWADGRYLSKDGTVINK